MSVLPIPFSTANSDEGSREKEGDKVLSMTGSLVATQIFSYNVNFLMEGLCL